MMTKHFFWGVYEGNEGDETWKVLHDHFEKLARQTNDGSTEEHIVTERKAAKRMSEGTRD
jgi:hypothetical protein